MTKGQRRANKDPQPKSHLGRTQSQSRYRLKRRLKYQSKMADHIISDYST